MVKVTAWAIAQGERREVLAEVDSVQVTCDDLRDPDGNVILHYFAPDMTWFDVTGNGWYDWTVEAI
jgi:hypothetical protein